MTENPVSVAIEQQPEGRSLALEALLPQPAFAGFIISHAL